MFVDRKLPGKKMNAFAALKNQSLTPLFTFRLNVRCNSQPDFCQKFSRALRGVSKLFLARTGQKWEALVLSATTARERD